VAFTIWLFHIFWIATCAAGMLCATSVLVGGAWPSATPVGFVFCATAFAYGFAARGLRERLAWAFGAASVFLFFQLEPTQQAVFLFAAVMWVLYHGLPGGRAGLRRAAVAKPLAIALVWAVSTVWLPLPIGKWLPASFLFVGRASFVFALALAYDLCDRHLDRLHGFVTLVQQIGPRRSLRLTDAALVLASGCAFANYGIGLFDGATLAAIWASLAATAWVIRFVPERTGWGIWRKMMVDGLMILQTIAIVLSSM